MKILPPIMVNNVSLLVILTFLLTLILMFNNPIMHATIFYNTLVCDDLRATMSWVTIIKRILQRIKIRDHNHYCDLHT